MKFVSGRLKLDVKFNDRTDKYQVKLCPVVSSERCENVTVGPPKSGSRSRHGKRLAVDDPRAMRDAAHAAISFASENIQEYADTNRRGSGWLVRPPKHRTRR